MSIRGYTSYPAIGFGKGLNLQAKPDALDQAECIDAMNVVFTDRGAIRQRAGYTPLTASALANRADSLSPFYTSGGTRQLLAGCGTRLEAVSTAGAVVDSETGLNGGPYGFSRFGKPNGEVAYAGNGTDTLRKWDGSEWTAPTATVNGEVGKTMPRAGALCAWPGGGNRLVATKFATTTGGPGGAISSPDHVWFSEPGDPEAWMTKEGEENYVQLSPGNGEAIQAVVAWREFVFVFKETSFYVFYAASGSPSPEFSFRPVEAGVGLVSPRAVAVHHTGVYFMSRQGVYRTAGQEPELISSLVEPIWTNEASVFYIGGTISTNSITNCAMTVFEDRIYLSFPTETTNNRTLVYDPQFEWWSITNLPCAALTTFRVSSREDLVFAYASGEKDIGRHASAYTNDDGTAISSHWRSGWFDLENPDIKTIRSSKLWGEGRVFCALGHDFGEGVGAEEVLDFRDPTADTWGGTTWGGGEWADPKGLLPAHRRRAVRGTVHSLYFANSTLDQTWSVHRADHHVREIAKPERASTT